MYLKLRDKIHSKIDDLLSFSPIVALLGPRQIGKTTLAKTFAAVAHYDLENPAHEQLLRNPEMAFKRKHGLIVIGEVQRMPSLFPFLRYWTDENPGQRFLLLGSASRDLVNSSSESLAGRIVYVSIDGFLINELSAEESYLTLWQRGGFPRSFLAPSDQASIIWRQEYIKTFLNVTYQKWGSNCPALL